MLWSVLAVSAKDIMYFLLMFVILMLGFGLMGEQVGPPLALPLDLALTSP